MPKRRRGTTPEGTVDPLVKEITGTIIARAEAAGLTREQLASRAGKKNASGLYGWRNGSRQNPSILDVEAFARAVGMHVGLIGDVSSRTSEAPNVSSMTRQLVAIMESLTPEGQRDLLELAATYKKTWGGSQANPHEPVEDAGGSPGRLNR